MENAGFSDLFSVLFYCFLIILFGYAAGRFNAITSTQSHGIGSFISIFALPALLFKSMVELNFDMVSWTLLLSIFLAKAILFISVFAIAVFVLRRKGIGKGGLYGIFVTQSNDFAIGYPIVHALYSENYPELLQYIYLAAPISLLIINPFGFLCMEIDRQWRKKHEVTVTLQQESTSETAGSSSMCDNCPSSGVCDERVAATTSETITQPEDTEKLWKVLLRALFHLLLNPIIFMVFIGFAFHFIFKGKIPDVLTPLVSSLSNAFSATALFYLGLTMVGKIGKQAGVKMLVPAMLIIAKILVLPVLIRQILLLLHNWIPVVNPHAGLDTASYHNGTWFGNMSYLSILGNYGFLYGTLPTAPTVVIYAAKFDVEADRIAAAMVVCTTLSAPIMYVSAWTLTISQMDYKFYERQIAVTAQDCSIIGTLASLWCIIVFFLSKKFQRIPHFFTLLLTSSMFLASLMAIINGFAITSETPTTSKIVSFFFLFVGVNASRLYTASLALSIVFVKYYGDLFVRRYQWFLIIFPAFLSIITATVVVVTQSILPSPLSPVFVFGFLQDATSFATILLSLLVCMTSLVLLFRLPNLFEKQRSTSQSLPGNTANAADRERLMNREDPNDSSDSSLLSEDEAGDRWLQYSSGDKQIGRHVSLLLLLCVSLLIGAVLTGWRVTKYELSGVYFEIGFLDSVFNFGQALFVLFIFGFDEELILDPLIQIWYRLRGSHEIPQSKLADLDQDVLRQCHVFVKYHMDNCKRALLHNKRHGLTIHRDVLTGSDLCTWLVEVGLASDRKEAVHYGQHLLNARLLHHVTHSHNFYDKNFLYQFENRIRITSTLPPEPSIAPPGAASSDGQSPKRFCARRRKCKLGPKRYSFEHYLKESDSPSPGRFSTKLKKQRVAAVKAENSFASDRSASPEIRSSDDHPLIDLQPNQQENLKMENENSETSTDRAMPKKVNLKNLTDW